MQQFYRVVKAPRPPHLSFPGLTLPSPRFYFVSLPRASSKNKAMIAARSWFCKEPRRTARLLCKAGSSRAVGRNPPCVLWRETKGKHRPEAIGFVFLFTNHLGAGRHQLPGPLKQSSRLPFSSQPGERSQACSAGPFVLSLQNRARTEGNPGNAAACPALPGDGNSRGRASSRKSRATTQPGARRHRPRGGMAQPGGPY